MKKRRIITRQLTSLCLAAVCFLGIYKPSLQAEVLQDRGATIIMAPLDSRPVSMEYVGDLATLGGDAFISVNKNSLDFFTDRQSARNRFGESHLVREEIFQLTGKHNKADTTVILNTASYLTNGLVGSRCISNYGGVAQGLKDLETLVTTYTAPYYYVNATMPRTLPEERNNVIWPNADKVKGLGSFYLKYHPEDTAVIGEQFKRVTPAQFLLEWGYVEGKQEELGRAFLAPWEKDFLDYFYMYYLHNALYGHYADAYRSVYEEAGKMIKALIDLQQAGKIDELVISIDDFQLPQFIQYYSQLPGKDTSWIQREDQHIIKYSFSRSYLKTGVQSVYAYERSAIGEEAFKAALAASSTTINHLYGVDEVPQLIYARDLARRKQLTTQFGSYGLGHGLNEQEIMGYVGFYDSATTKELLDTTKNFVSNCGRFLKTTDRPFKMYVSQHISGSESENAASIKQLLLEMFGSYQSGSNIGLIEIMSFDAMQTGENELFKKLTSQAYLQALGLYGHSVAQLRAYSSWNTGANAIGLGMAQAQVYGIAEQLSKMPEETAVNVAKVLAQHLLEDGVYSVQLKAGFDGNHYGLHNASSMLDNEVLKQKLNSSGILPHFLSGAMRIGEKQVILTEATIRTSSFPWLRRFECYVETDFKA